jgi:hypothetical protein
MAGPWVEAGDLKQSVADILKEADVAALEPRWDRQIPLAIQTAYSDLVGILLARGYTIGQLDQWDNRVTYNRQQALFWLYTEAGLGQGYDDKEIDKLDRRKELKETATIMVNGTPVTPGNEDAAGAYGGTISECGYRITGETEF